jgi:ferredoxin
MPFVITDACIRCDACVPVCPNDGISKGEVRYVIDQDFCTECVGFFSRPQCASVCPMDCCVLKPDVFLTEEGLFERAKALHVNSDKQPTLTPDTSHLWRAAAGNQKAAAGKWWERVFRSLYVHG